MSLGPRLLAMGEREGRIPESSGPPPHPLSCLPARQSGLSQTRSGRAVPSTGQGVAALGWACSCPNSSGLASERRVPGEGPPASEPLWMGTGQNPILHLADSHKCPVLFEWAACRKVLLTGSLRSAP